MVLTAELVSEISVFLGLFGVLLQEDHGVCDAAVLQKPRAQSGQLQTGMDTVRIQAEVTRAWPLRTHTHPHQDLQQLRPDLQCWEGLVR